MNQIYKKFLSSWQEHLATPISRAIRQLVQDSTSQADRLTKLNAEVTQLREQVDALIKKTSRYDGDGI